MHEQEAIGDMFIQKRLIKKQEIIDIAKDPKRKNTPTDPTQTSLF